MIEASPPGLLFAHSLATDLEVIAELEALLEEEAGDDRPAGG